MAALLSTGIVLSSMTACGFFTAKNATRPAKLWHLDWHAGLTKQPILTMSSTSVETSQWRCIRQAESGDNYSEPAGGAYQFQGPAFNVLTGLSGSAQDYSRQVQDKAALLLYAWDLRYWHDPWKSWATRFVCGLER